MFKIILTITLLGLHGRTLPPMDAYPHTFTTQAECEEAARAPEFQAGVAEIGQGLARQNLDNVIGYECVSTGLTGPQVDPNGNEVPRKPDAGTISPPLDRG